MDYTNVFTNLNFFPTHVALSDNGTGKKKVHVILTCGRGGGYRKFTGNGRKVDVKKKKKTDDDDFDEDKKKDYVKWKRDIGTKKCGCSFILKGTQVSPHDWRLEVKNGIHIIS
ncbi:hypothetical protein ACS0TY_010842 [Phlomoides rotata]